jgi:hypothetical protein
MTLAGDDGSGAWDGWIGALIGAAAGGIFAVLAAIVAAAYASKKTREDFRDQERRRAVGTVSGAVFDLIDAFTQIAPESVPRAHLALVSFQKTYLPAFGALPQPVRERLELVAVWLTDQWMPALESTAQRTIAEDDGMGNVEFDQQALADFDALRTDVAIVLGDLAHALIVWQIEDKLPDPRPFPQLPNVTTSGD